MPGMLALSETQARVMNGCFIELKIDGTRMSYEKGTLTSDRGIIRNDRFGHLLEVEKINWKVRGEVAIPGGNVLQVNARTGWPKAKFFIFDLFELDGQNMEHLSLLERRHIVSELIEKHKLTNVQVPMAFSTFDEGWAYVKANKSEGLVLTQKDGTKWKVKILQEEKLRIIGHDVGKSKGSFRIIRKGIVGNVSGTSDAFVQAYKMLKAEGKEVFAEVEFPFITEDGVPYQPRLRRLGTLEDLVFT